MTAHLTRSAVVAVLVCLLPQGASAQCLPVRLADVESFLRTGVSDAALQAEIRECGTDVVWDSGTEDRLRALGASDGLIDALGRAARPIAPAGPPDNVGTGHLWVAPLDNREMVYVEPADFQMGSPPEENGDADEILHTVRIPDGFWMDRTEVTNLEYQAFIVANPEWQPDAARAAGDLVDSSYLRDWVGSNFPPGLGDLPVVNVSWHAASAFARWAGKRLPTEAEWEYATRAGTSTAYWWGDQFDPARANAGSDLRPVARDLAVNPWFIYDLLGNVAEWTSSLYRPYPYDGRDGRESAVGPGNRVVRGGSYLSNSRFLRAANRNQLAPEVTSERVGFRCVRSRRP